MVSSYILACAMDSEGNENFFTSLTRCAVTGSRFAYLNYILMITSSYFNKLHSSVPVSNLSV